MRSHFLVRLAMILHAALALTLLISWFHSAQRREFWRADFSMFYTGFAMVVDGEAEQLYNLELQLAYQRAVIPERGPASDLLPFNYPPHTAVTGAVFAYLSRSSAFYTWSVIQLGLLVLLLRQLWSWAAAWSLEQRLLLIITALAFPPVFASFQMGQLSLLMLVALVGMVKAIEDDRPVPAALWFVLTTLKPQFAIVPAMMLVATVRWRVLALATCFGLLWATLTTKVVGLTAWLDWFHVLRESATTAGQLGIHPDRMYNVKGFLFGVFGPEALPLINRLCLFAFLLGALLPLVVVPNTRVKVACCLQVGFLTSLHFNPADAVVFVLPAMLYTLARASVWVLVLPVLFYIDCYQVTHWPLGIRPFFVAMVVLAVASHTNTHGSEPRTK
jgi:hypothetical protein